MSKPSPLCDAEQPVGRQVPSEAEDRTQPQVAQAVDWMDFRDHLATADQQGRRKWIYAKRPEGRFYRWRTQVSWLLLGIMFAGPFITIQGNPLLLLNIVERRFSVLGQVFWPQDAVIFAVAMLLFLMGIVVFTTAFGRLWCGWTCPHTLLQDMVFRKIDFWIEGDARAQRLLDGEPWNRRKIMKKTAKHLIYFCFSFLVANTLLSYIIGVESLLQIATDDPRRHLTGLTFLLLFTFLFYGIFARFREQACTFICPYGRLQSTLLDENSMVVAYDYKRGEKRAHYAGSHSPEGRRADGLGDCVDCMQCVAVCPTGIDIRNGTQMECVNCTACIDACDRVMARIGRPHGLIRYASLNSIELGKPFRLTARMGWYGLVLAGLAAVLGLLLFTRADVETIMLRAPGALYLQRSDGRIENLYTLKLVNKTSRDISIQLKLENIPGEVKLMGAGRLTVPKRDLAHTSVLVSLDRAALAGPSTPLKVGVFSEGKKLETVNTVFAGPRSAPY